MTQARHIPVLLSEVIEALGVKCGGRWVDSTLGAGGHAAAILEASSPDGQLLGIDADPEAIKAARMTLEPYGRRALLVEGNFAQAEAICSQYDFGPASGILFDLGMSSLQLDDGDRGFSFRFDAPLDMRFSPAYELTAADMVNILPQAEMASVLKSYGQERRSRSIARRIVESRPLRTTLQLVRAVEQAGGARRGRIHPATRTFLALRIAVNRELEHLDAALKGAVNLLGQGGRLVVISYHSLEDRLVKGFFHRESRDCLCPPETPQCVCGHSPTLRLVAKKVITPSSAEVGGNPRSRSAKMRVAEKIAWH
jgi:16S rRNA (cytosine1402-N4)-methyltransferase